MRKTKDINNRTSQVNPINSNNPGDIEELRKIAALAKLEAVKAYPDMVFADEMKNPEFVEFLKLGLSPKNAYELLHLDELLEKSREAGAIEAENRVREEYRSRASRPNETGASSAPGVLVGNGAGTLTKEQRREAVKLAAQGKKISF